MTAAVILLALVTMERLAELWWARRNTEQLMKLGGIEHGASHYPLIVGLHVAWLGGLWYLGWAQPVSVFWLCVFLLLQLGRTWVLISLGRRWTTRIVVLPNEPLVRSGPYRFLSHPNYVVVAGEIAVLPLCLGLPWYAVAFSIANAVVLMIRLRSETAALAGSAHGLGK
jgi:methyltransferase